MWRLHELRHSPDVLLLLCLPPQVRAPAIAPRSLQPHAAICSLQMTLSSARRPCCARSGGPPDLLMVGDSSIDFMKFQGEPGSYEQREQWATLQQRFSEVGFRVDNIGCGGAPFYELCLGTFCYMCRRATRPTTGIIASMG